ncbi:M15 family metallopeptidase [Candidatus Parcubacteria bacterium]|nr:M15 family metallopeptidase [Candidatus Parcubacteria bacterium]
MKKLLVILLILLIASGSAYFFIGGKRTNTPDSDRQKQNEQAEENNNPDEFDKIQYSLTDPASLWVIVNKQRPIPTDYVPTELATPEVRRDPTDSAEEQKIKSGVDERIETMFSDAQTAGYRLLFASGYRSADLQAVYYNGYVARDGQAAADKYSARPGTSEHQTGLAFDISRADRKCYLEICFGETPEGKWLAQNAHKYGFTLRYKQGKKNITGYQYEPWHFRYVGEKLAAKLHETDQTMEEFFGL